MKRGYVFCLLEPLLFKRFILPSYITTLTGKKMTTLIVTEHSLCFFSSSGIYVENYPRTQHTEEHSDPTAVWTPFFLPNNRWPLQTEPVLCLVKKPPEAVGGARGGRGGRLGNLSSEAWMNSGQALLTFSWLPKQTHPKTHKSSRGIKCPAASFKKTNPLEWASLFNQRLTAATVMTICVALSRRLYCDWLFLHQLRPPGGVSWRWLTQYCLELTKVTKI